jgi:hypothetical protein
VDKTSPRGHPDLAVAGGRDRGHCALAAPARRRTRETCCTRARSRRPGDDIREATELGRKRALASSDARIAESHERQWHALRRFVSLVLRRSSEAPLGPRYQPSQCTSCLPPRPAGLYCRDSNRQPIRQKAHKWQIAGPAPPHFPMALITPLHPVEVVCKGHSGLES